MSACQLVVVCVFRQNEGSFGCEEVARALGSQMYLNVGQHFSLCSKNFIVIVSLSFFLRLACNV